MKFTPLSDEQINEQRGILKPGISDFEVMEAKDEISKSGNEMIKLMLKVWDSEGKVGIIFDYLVSSAIWKIKHFFDSIGNPGAYLSGNSEAFSLVGASGKAEIVIKKDPNGKYGDKPVIKDYVCKSVSVQASVKDAKEVFTDDIPF